MPTPGIDLKVQRVRANVTITELAARMGLSRQSLWAIERAGAVDGERARQYREALQASIDAIETSDKAAQSA